jgi:hypothetical protein
VPLFRLLLSSAIPPVKRVCGEERKHGIHAEQGRFGPDARSYMQLSYLTLEPSEIDMGEGRSERRNEGGSDEMISCVTYRQSS